MFKLGWNQMYYNQYNAWKRIGILEILYYDQGNINDCSGGVELEILMTWLWRKLHPKVTYESLFINLKIPKSRS